MDSRITDQQREGLRQTEQEAARALFARGAVRATLRSSMKSLSYLVVDGHAYEVRLADDGSMSCMCELFRAQGFCRHTYAAILSAKKEGLLLEMYRRRAMDAAKVFTDSLEKSTGHDTMLSMETHLILREDGNIYAGIRIGESRMYVVRDLVQFFAAMRSGQKVDYGKSFVFQPQWMRFSQRDTRILDVLRQIIETKEQAGVELRGVDARLLQLTDTALETLLELLADGEFVLSLGEKEWTVEGIREIQLPLRYKVSSNARGIHMEAELISQVRPLTSSQKYVFADGVIARLTEEQLAVYRAILPWLHDGRGVFEFVQEDAQLAITELVPRLRLTGAVELSEELARNVVREPLSTQIYLDREGMGVVARVLFHYGDTALDPFKPVRADSIYRRGEKLLMRDATGEREIFQALNRWGFHVRPESAVLKGEQVYRFLTEGLAELQGMAEVFMSHEFRRLTPRKPMFHARIGVSGSKLELLLEENGEPTGETLEIMRALAQRKDYYRLKNGAFLELSDLEAWQSLAEAVAEAAQQPSDAEQDPDTGALLLQGYRAVYFSDVLSSSELDVERSEAFVETVRALKGESAQSIEAPRDIELRPYQLRGFQWLAQLERLRMGGVLADDMGLGKTVQMIALLKSVRASGEVSLVVAPTSLIYNWLSELNRFAPELSVMVLSGTAAQRASMIRHVREAGDVDVLITSYPLIRRDIAALKDMCFRVVVLDEAQQIKNAGSVAAAAVKQLQGQARFALTGTPLENSAGELWSIYDFALPGYLNSYTSFMRRYQDGQDADDLRRRIRPFLLRRIKRDVLTELPDKLETVMTAQLTPEQQKVYQAALLRLRGRVDQVLNGKGMSRGRMEVLAAITELRQICCHPSLVLDGYAGSSGKLELLLDTLPPALQAGHRVLIFSQFTSMLRILTRHLESVGMRCMYLDGSTPAEERLRLCEQFNAGQAEIFLISLKAGGTGLNLTGADMVIHYDPWWNPAAEDQATDRAHRIGQKHKVEVIRLMTHGTIEEQVVELGQRKRALFDRLITPGEELMTALTEQDVRALFTPMRE